jgi:hypothetical protein
MPRASVSSSGPCMLLVPVLQQRANRRLTLYVGVGHH